MPSFFADSHPAEFLWASYDHTDITITVPSRCLFCHGNLTFAGEPWWVIHCKDEECGWWMHTPPPVPEGWHTLTHAGKWSVIKNFDIDDAHFPTHLLADFLKRHPGSLVHTNATAFEKLVLSLLKEVSDISEVIHVGGPGDGGRDLIGVLKNGEPFLVEIKRRQKIYKAESVDTVRRLVGVMIRDGYRAGMIVSTAKKFSPDAQTFAISDDKSLADYWVGLRSYDDIVSWLQISRTVEPWQTHITPETLSPGINVYLRGI
jgi:hypothetical protein